MFRMIYGICVMPAGFCSTELKIKYGDKLHACVCVCVHFFVNYELGFALAHKHAQSTIASLHAFCVSPRLCSIIM